MITWRKTSHGHTAQIGGQVITVKKNQDNEWVVIANGREHDYFPTIGRAKKAAESFFGGL